MCAVFKEEVNNTCWDTVCRNTQANKCKAQFKGCYI